jgi:hypothetical protein
VREEREELMISKKIRETYMQFKMLSLDYISLSRKTKEKRFWHVAIVKDNTHSAPT